MLGVAPKKSFVYQVAMLGMLSACAGMFHEPSGQGSETTATFEMFTVSSYDTPFAEWSELSTDKFFSYYECLVERIHQVTDEVTETGVWETCESPYDLRTAPGIDVEEGFNGLLTVRAVSTKGKVGKEITKKFRRAVWMYGVDNSVDSIGVSPSSDVIYLGGNFTKNADRSSVDASRIARINSDGSPDLSVQAFAQGFDQETGEIALQGDGKILVSGGFTSYNGDESVPDGFIRLNSDGTRDLTFVTPSVAPVTFVEQADGRILIGGYDGAGYVPDGIMRLNSDGSVDATFTGVTSGVDGGQVNVITVQTDGKILIGGSFATFNGAASPDGLMRLNANGSVDASFNGITSGFNNSVRSIAVQTDGKILVGGDFTSFNGSAGAPDGLIRLNANGAVDGTFTGVTTGFDNYIGSIIVQDDGKILIAGVFNTFNGSGAISRSLMRLNANGSIDTTFSGVGTGFNSSVLSIALQDDGKIVAGGNFTMLNGEFVAHALIRLNSDGSRDAAFTGLVNGFDRYVNSLVLQDDGKILAVGRFVSYNAKNRAVFSGYVASFSSVGNLTPAFSFLGTGFNGNVNAVAVQPDGRILMGGDFTSYNGADIPDRLIRFNADGTVDSAFSGNISGFNGAVNAITLQPDGKILVGGMFTTFNGASSVPDYLIRLNADGSVDPTFSGATTGFDNWVVAIALQSDGKIIVGGYFSAYNGSAGAPDRIIRLNSNGGVDTTFSGLTTGFDTTVTSIAVQSDGKILVGGGFTSYNGSAAAPDSFIRLTSSGSVDASFTGLTTGFDAFVLSIAVQSDGRILVGGDFTAYNGVPGVPDKLLRFNADGTVDSTFVGSTSGFNLAVNIIAVQSDGKILVGGDFTSYNGDAAISDRIMRLNADGTVDQTFMGQRH